MAKSVCLSIDRDNLKGNRALALYVTLYIILAISMGSAAVQYCGYNELAANKEKLKGLIENDIVVEVKQNKSSTEKATGLKCGNSEFYSFEIQDYWWIWLPLAVIFWAILMRVILLYPSTLKGILILFLTVLTVLFFHFISNKTIPSNSILLSGFFGGALFWWIANFVCNKKSFPSICEGDFDLEELKLLYDYTKQIATFVITLFLGICISLAFNISSTINDQYAKAGLACLLTGWTIWLVFWGSLGLLGGIGAECGRRLNKIIGCLPVNKTV